MTSTVLNIHQNIVDQCRKNDPDGQRELYRLYSKAMFNICLRITNSYEDAEDVLQEAFVNAFKNFKSYKEEATVGAWLKRIMVNTAVNHVKKKRLELVPLENSNPVPVSEETFEEKEITSFEISRIKEAVNELPDGFRVVFSLYIMEGYDHKEIAEILNITESTSKSQLNRAKKKLRDTLNAQVNYG
ncbi:MAG: sigma-70 family RNA polymerase sigma factor [Bacteroidota bacterium]